MSWSSRGRALCLVGVLSLVQVMAQAQVQPQGQPGPQGQLVLHGAGATFPSRVYERWVQRFSGLNPQVRVHYAPTGSGDGIRQIKARHVDFGGTDDPLTPRELEDAHLVQIPMLVGGLVPVLNLPGVATNELVLSGAVLADIYQGQIRQWNDARIAALNPGLRLPALAIQPVVRAEASGSTFVWTRFLGLSSTRFAATVPASQKPAWPTATLAAKGNDGVAVLVRQTPGALGYVSYDRVVADRLSAARLRTPGGETVRASEEGFRAAILASDVYRQGDDLASLLAMARPLAWPVTATSYLLLDAQPTIMARADLVARFVYWCFMNGDELTRGTGFAPLPARVQARLYSRLLKIRGPQGQVPELMTP